MQKVVRGYLARKKHRPRYQGIMKIKSIKQNAMKTIAIANDLKSGKENIMKDIQVLENEIDSAIKKIKVS